MASEPVEGDCNAAGGDGRTADESLGLVSFAVLGERVEVRDRCMLGELDGEFLSEREGEFVNGRLPADARRGTPGRAVSGYDSSV